MDTQDLKKRGVDWAATGVCPSGRIDIHERLLKEGGFLLIGDVIRDFKPGVYFVRILRRDNLSEHYMVLHTPSATHAVLITAEQAREAQPFLINRTWEML